MSGLQITMIVRNAVLVPRFAIIFDISNQGLRHHLGLNEEPACAATPISCSVEFCLILQDDLTFSTRHENGRDKQPEVDSTIISGCRCPDLGSAPIENLASLESTCMIPP